MSDIENNRINEEEPLPQKEEAFRSPFGLEPVDPLVFRQGSDEVAPELRAGVSRLPIPRANDSVQLPPPPKPSRRKYTEWVPGGRGAKIVPSDSESAESAGTKVRTTLRRVAAFLAILIPFSVIIYLVHLVMNLYHN